MPLSLRNVTPVDLSNDSREMRKITKNLEHFKNYTLVNIIRQLSNLSKHAEDIFSSIHEEAADILRRTSSLRIKVHKLSGVIDTLDPLKDDDDLEGALQRVPYYSKSACENNIMDRIKLPKPVQVMYQTCEGMPKLDLLTEFREDGQSGCDLYSKPSYFFDLWRSEQEKSLSTKGDKRKRKAKNRPYKRRPHLVSRPSISHPAMMQRKEQLKLKGEGKELAEIHSEEIRAKMEAQRVKDGNEQLSNGSLGEYSEVSGFMTMDPSATITDGLISALKRQGLLEYSPKQNMDETDVVANLLQQKMDLSDSEDIGWEEDEFSDEEDATK